MLFTGTSVLSSRVRRCFLFTAVLLVPFVSGSCQSTSLSSYQTPDKGFGEKEILNYEYTNKYYAEEIRNSHFLINTEIEKPLIIKIQLPKTDLLHRISPICGSAVVKISADSSGRVVSYEFVKRAGLDLDGYIDEMMKTITIKPLYLKGERGNSEFLARFVFSGSR